MIAKLSNRQPGYRIGPDITQEQDGLAPLAVNRLTVVDVTCPSCEHETTLAYGGWTAIVCQGCQVVLYRNRRSAPTAPETAPEPEPGFDFGFELTPEFKPEPEPEWHQSSFATNMVLALEYRERVKLAHDRFKRDQKPETTEGGTA